MIVVEAPPKLIRCRKRGPKVKSGCKTCKVRRVKCDEGKPSCYRCTSTGRSCDGYAPIKEDFQVQVWAQSRDLDPWNPVTVLAGFGDGVRYLEFYHRCARPNLASTFDEEFWSRIALQLAHREPAVRHALMALGALCETEPGDIKHAYKTFATGRECKAVLTHYNKSVRTLVQRMAEPTYTPEVGLVTCLLFVCIEFIRGHYHTAFTHMRNGLSIISERRQKLRHDSMSPSETLAPTLLSLESTGDRSYRALQSTDVHSPSRSVERDFGTPPHPITIRAISCRSSGQPNIIEDKLVPLFIRGVASAIMYGADADDNLDIPAPSPSLLDLPAFESLRDAEESSSELRNTSSIFIRDAARRLFKKEPVNADDLQQQRHLLTSHDAWKEKLDLFLKTHKLSDAEKPGLHTLWTCFYLIYIYVSCSIWIDEMQYDRYLDMFKKINHHAEICINTRKQVSIQGAPHFTFEVSVIIPLFFVACRCRCPTTRRQAVSLLERNPPREGLWDAKQHVLVAKRVIEMEEQQVDTASGWPVQQTRVHSAVINAGMDGNGGFWASFLTADLLASTGPNGGQKLIQQFFRIE